MSMPITSIVTPNKSDASPHEIIEATARLEEMMRHTLNAVSKEVTFGHEVKEAVNSVRSFGQPSSNR